MNKDPENKDSEDFDPFAIRPKAPDGARAKPKKAAGVGLPQWLLPVVAGLVGVAFIVIVFSLYTTKKTQPDQQAALPLIPAQEAVVRREPSDAVSPKQTSQTAVYDTFNDKESSKEESLLSDKKAMEEKTAQVSDFEKQTDQINEQIEHSKDTSVKQPEPIKQESRTKPEQKAEASNPADSPNPPMPPKSKPAPPKVSVSTVTSGGSSTSVLSITPADGAQNPQGEDEDTLAFVQSVLGQQGGEQHQTQKATITTAVPAVPAADAYYVQLGSVRDQTRASQEWDRLQIEFPADFAGVPHRIQRADLGARGVYYRIQAGPFSNEHARGICTSIKAKRPSVGCLVVR